MIIRFSLEKSSSDISVHKSQTVKVIKVIVGHVAVPANRKLFANLAFLAKSRSF